MTTAPECASLSPVLLVEPPDSAVIDHGQLPSFDDTVVEKSSRVVSHRFAGGVMLDQSHRLQDGSRYNSRLLVPIKQRFDIVATATTPWCTDLNGFNTEAAKLLVDEGMSVLLVSPEQAKLPRALWKLVKTVVGDTMLMAHDAKAQHSILDALEPTADFNAGTALNYGYSRGAMTGLGFQGYAAQHGRQLPFNEYTDPCVEHAIGEGEMNIRELPGYFCKEEPAELYAALQTHRISQLKNLAKTARINPAFWVNQAATGVAIFRGEAGTFVDSLPEDTHTYVRLFKGSKFNQAIAWQHRLRSFTNVFTTIEDGWHMSGTKPVIYSETASRLGIVQESLHAGMTPAELNTELLVRSTSADII